MNEETDKVILKASDKQLETIHELLDITKLREKYEDCVGIAREGMILAMRHFNYVFDGKEYGNNIAIALEHEDTTIEYKADDPFHFDLYLGKNLTISCLKNLQELCKICGWSPVLTRTKRDTIYIWMVKQC